MQPVFAVFPVAEAIGLALGAVPEMPDLVIGELDMQVNRYLESLCLGSLPVPSQHQCANHPCRFSPVAPLSSGSAARLMKALYPLLAPRPSTPIGTAHYSTFAADWTWVGSTWDVYQ